MSNRNPKHQIPASASSNHHCQKRITPSPREGRAGRGLGRGARFCGIWSLGFGAFLGFGIWDLEFGTTAHAAAELKLTYVDLVRRLTDLEHLAAIPAPGERCAQWSSYDRASRYDSATGKYLK